MHLKLAHTKRIYSVQKLQNKKLDIRAHFNNFVIELSQKMVEEFYLSPSKNKMTTIINNN